MFMHLPHQNIPSAYLSYHSAIPHLISCIISSFSLTKEIYDLELFESGIPTLGICYGMQLMNFISGGKIEKRDNREDGQHLIQVDSSSALFQGIL